MKYTAEGTITLAVSVTWDGDGSDAEPWDAAGEHILAAFWEWVNAGGGYHGCRRLRYRRGWAGVR